MKSRKIRYFLIWDDVGIVPYKSEFIVLFVFLCRGRVSRPAGGETPPLQGLTEFVICTDNSNL